MHQIFEHCPLKFALTVILLCRQIPSSPFTVSLFLLFTIYEICMCFILLLFISLFLFVASGKKDTVINH